VSALLPRAFERGHQPTDDGACAGKGIPTMSTRPKSQNVEAPPIAEGSAAKRQVFTRDEVAAILRLSVDTVDSEIKRGKLKSFKRGRHVGVTGAAVDAYLRGAS